MPLAVWAKFSIDFGLVLSILRLFCRLAAVFPLATGNQLPGCRHFSGHGTLYLLEVDVLHLVNPDRWLVVRAPGQILQPAKHARHGLLAGQQLCHNMPWFFEEL